MQAVTPEGCRDYAWNVDFEIDSAERNPEVWEEWIGALEVSQAKWINRDIVRCNSEGNWELNRDHCWVSKILACMDYVNSGLSGDFRGRIETLYQRTMAEMRGIIEKMEKKKNRCC